jgi:xanthine dehydrogenase accessory factor
VIAIKGGGEMASAVAWRLFMANLKKIFMMETANPLAVRREVSFCEAVHGEKKEVEGVEGVLAHNLDEVKAIWRKEKIAVIVDPSWQTLKSIRADVVVDAILAKKNLGTSMNDASVVIGLGPGFSAGHDVDMVIETNRGHNLGKILTSGKAERNTGVPGPIAGYDQERVLRAPTNGRFLTSVSIGDLVEKSEIVASVAGEDIAALINGVVRGLIRPRTQVTQGMKVGDIDPRGDTGFCYTISDKARAIAGSVLEAIMRVHNC